MLHLVNYFQILDLRNTHTIKLSVLVSNFMQTEARAEAVTSVVATELEMAHTLASASLQHAVLS